MISDTTQTQKRAQGEHQRLLELAHATRLTMLSEMAATITHDINQPLTAIANYSAACLRMVQSERATPPELVQWLTAINKQAERASQMLRRLCEFISKGQISPTLIDLDQLLSEVLDFMASEARLHRVTIESKTATAGCQIRADKLLIEQALLSLMRNSIQSLSGVKRRRRQLWLHTAREGGNVMIVMRDNGLGIPPNPGKRIGDLPLTVKLNDLEMELAVSQSLIEAHQGALRVVSAPGQGNTFTVNLPAAEKDEHDTNT